MTRTDKEALQNMGQRGSHSAQSQLRTSEFSMPDHRQAGLIPAQAAGAPGHSVSPCPRLRADAAAGPGAYLAQ
eukprot:768475-Hanusia_phi.AAC.1